MKKYTFIIGVLIFLGLATTAGIFYHKNFRGVGPALRPPATVAPPPANNNTAPPSPNTPITQNTTGLPLTLPDGFSISTFAKVDGARAMMFDTSSRLLISQTSQGKVVALPDENTDGKADITINLLSGLRKPHGLALNCEGNTGVQQCKLFVAEEHRVMVYDYDQSAPKATNGKKIIDLPTEGGGHFTRTLLIVNTSQGKKLLTSIGSSCNVCIEEDPRRAAIYNSNLDGTDFKPFATGLRNSVFMTIHPTTGQVWATEMGRDLIGDNIPPEEVNIIEENKNYGWPICYDDNIHDTQFDKNKYIQNPCADKTPPHIKFQAHSAPLGLAFVPDDANHVGKFGRTESWPLDWKNDLLIAYHGSWNRSVPTGYKIVRYDLDDNGTPLPPSPSGRGQGEGIDFLTGFLTPNSKSAYGRPVDILALPGGYMYVSDDHAGHIYLIKYVGTR